jgi:hypothetical protein
MRCVDVASELRSLADECVKLAQQADSPERKVRLLEMAQAWRKLAEDTARIQATKEKSGKRGHERGARVGRRRPGS